MDVYGEDAYNVEDISEDDYVISFSDSDESVTSELFQKVCEFDEVFARQLKDFTTPPKRKSEEDLASSPSKCPRISSPESPGTS